MENTGKRKQMAANGSKWQQLVASLTPTYPPPPSIARHAYLLIHTNLHKNFEFQRNRL